MVTMDFRKRQTIAASPAEPGESPARFSGTLIGDPLEFLVARRCPEVAALANPDLRPSDRKALEKKVASFRGRLKEMPPEEFRSLFKKETENWHLELRNKSGIIEESLDFMQSIYSADLAKWGAEASWTIDEAGALMIGRDPDRFPWDQVTGLRHSSPMFKRVCDFRRSASRMAEEQKWKLHVPAAKLVAWAQARGFEFPPELVGTVHAHEAPSSLSDDLTDDKLSPREIGSLLPSPSQWRSLAIATIRARRAAVARRRWNRMSKP